MCAGIKTALGRKREIDILKGILTITMILCHSIQFFGVEDDPVQGFLVNVINLTTFSGFVFCFGYVGEMAYFQKGWMEGACKMGKNMLRILIAFYLSGIAYVALVEGKIFRIDFIREVMFLKKYPGWSEFLVSFSAMLLIGILCFPVLKRMNGKILILSALISGSLCFLPYDKIQNSWLALFVGSRHYVTFPVLQYSFFFAVGIWFCKKQIKCKWQIMVISICLGLPCLFYYGKTAYLPERFPVSVWYLFGGCLFVYLYYLLACSYGNKVNTEEDFIKRFDKITTAVKEIPYVCGYCYTQVTDVQQEINGLMDIDRNFKVNVDTIKEINERQIGYWRKM